MREDLFKLLGFFAVTVALVVTVAVLGPRCLSYAAGPENEVITELKRVERVGLDELIAPVGRLTGGQIFYQRLSVSVAADGERAIVTGTLDFTGAIEGGPQVSSLGLEKVSFVKKGGDWVPDTGLVPRLGAILRALETRRAALERGELGPEPDGGFGPDAVRLLAMKQRHYRVRAWYIRSERDEVTVAEDYTLEGQLPERPVSDEGTRRLTLESRNGRDFLFPAGFM
jgi:hypothetical protein